MHHDLVDVLGADLLQVLPHLVGELGVIDHQLGVLGTEHVADDAQHQLRFRVYRFQHLGGSGLLLDLLPALDQPLDVGLELLGGGGLRRGPHDQAVALGLQALEDLAQPFALVVGQLAADAEHVVARGQDAVAAGEG